MRCKGSSPNQQPAPNNVRAINRSARMASSGTDRPTSQVDQGPWRSRIEGVERVELFRGSWSEKGQHETAERGRQSQSWSAQGMTTRSPAIRSFLRSCRKRPGQELIRSRTRFQPTVSPADRPFRKPGPT